MKALDRYPRFNIWRDSDIVRLLRLRPLLLELSDACDALQLWREGHDTKAISDILGFPEPYVANSIARMRDSRRLAA